VNASLIGSWLAALTLILSATATAGDFSAWEAEMDQAFIYSGEDPAALAARLEEMEATHGGSFASYARSFADPVGGGAAEQDLRRAAIANLLDHVAHSDVDALERSVRAVRALQPQLGRLENRYWFHYVGAHEAIARNDRARFVQNVFAIWLHVVAPLEDAREERAAAPRAGPGFDQALPYLYEDLARLILFRSSALSDRDLEPLAPILELLSRKRVGAFPDAIPRESSSAAYLEAIRERRAGANSDDGSLTFVLACFDAESRHRAALEAIESGSPGDAVRAVHHALAGYDAANRRAATAAGRATVLRESLELLTRYQRAAGAEPLQVEEPLRIESAMRVFSELRAAPAGLGPLGFRRTGLDGHRQLTHELWQAIENSSLSLAEAHLRRAAAVPTEAPELARRASVVAGRFLQFFEDHAPGDGGETMPDSATFAASQAARIAGEALLAFMPYSSAAEVEEGSRRLVASITLFPFDPRAWGDLASLLQKHGREERYPDLVGPIAARVTRSPVLDQWIASEQSESQAISALRRSMADPQLLVYLGFAGGVGSTSSLAALREERDDLRARLAARSAAGGEVPAAIDKSGAAANADEMPGDSMLGEKLRRTESRIAALERLMPAYDEALAAEGIAQALSRDRSHPLHVLLRRMYEERHPVRSRAR